MAFNGCNSHRNYRGLRIKWTTGSQRVSRAYLKTVKRFFNGLLDLTQRHVATRFEQHFEISSPSRSPAIAMTTPRVHIVGRKNSGKTTLIEQLVRNLSQAGYRVSTIKHTHHRHELDTPGKDSHRHRNAGATAVGILTRELSAVYWKSEFKEENNRYASLIDAMPESDLVLVEGDLHTTAPKVEVWRAAVSEQPYASQGYDMKAVISSDPTGCDVVTWPPGDIEEIACRLIKLLDIKK